jgi:predicted metal-dependent hydrolase
VVTPGKVEVVAPLKVSEQRIQQFVMTKQPWIIQALTKLEAKSQRHTHLLPTCYSHGADVPYQGQRYKLVIRPSTLKRIKIECSDEIIAYVPEPLLAEGHSDDVKRALIRWMYQQSKVQVELFVKHHSEKKQLYPRSIRIKTQKSRWGSCGIHNDIHINWLLIMAPPAVLEYVVVHELCHIQERNHSRHFWALVAEHLPSYQQQERWLKEHGSQLMQGL